MNARTKDFRERFVRMAPEALVMVDELAELLCTTRMGVWHMAHQGELPPTAFPGKRRSVWFVEDIRQWLSDAKNTRGVPPIADAKESVRIGRPRHHVPAKGAR